MVVANPDVQTVREIVARACRAPSLHNSQPWRWTWNGEFLRLYAEERRLLPYTDAFNRQGIIACGAALDHAQVAGAAAGWEMQASVFPDPLDRAHLASLLFRGRHAPLEADELLGTAIETRYTDRLPFTAPFQWSGLDVVLRTLCRSFGTHLHVVDRSRHRDLNRISDTAAALRRADPRYQEELHGWAGDTWRPYAGVPASARATAQAAEKVAAGRMFPVGAAGAATGFQIEDRAVLVVLSSDSDAVESVLDCGRALSQLLLECTVEGMSTCALTHVTETPSVRAMVSDLLGLDYPQVLVRIGQATAPRPPRTPRLPLESVLDTGHESPQAGKWPAADDSPPPNPFRRKG
ncbi:Acg family FMN-binding oxidoreductase [Nocardia carnea]|uniref:Acg family FMN-binding oxidoreductase n=1 Tax=Nocardia carnea TaxID=37328 RepID=UPI0024576D34|nr:nitroreductase family protein [Nocardia carnea]